MKNCIKITLSGLVTLSLILLCGCTAGDRYTLLEQSCPVYTPSNFQSVKSLPSHIRRVVLLPVYNGEVISPIWEHLDESFSGELGQRKLFEVVRANREQCDDWFRKTQWSSVEPLPANFLSLLQKKTQANAVLFVDITHYHPYKPLSLGVRSKLVDIVNGKILWSFDEVFDAGQLSVVAGVRDFYLKAQNTSYPLGYQQVNINSPRRFSQYVAHSMFLTMPE